MPQVPASRTTKTLLTPHLAVGRGGTGGNGDGGGSNNPGHGPRDDDSSPSLEWYFRAFATMLSAVGLYVLLGRNVPSRHGSGRPKVQAQAVPGDAGQQDQSQQLRYFALHTQLLLSYSQQTCSWEPAKAGKYWPYSLPAPPSLVFHDQWVLAMAVSPKRCLQGRHPGFEATAEGDLCKLC